MSDLARWIRPHWWAGGVMMMGWLCGAAARLPAEAADATGMVHFASSQLRLGFDARDGHLREFHDLKSAHDHVADRAGRLWEIKFLGSTGPLRLAPEQARSFRSEMLPGPQRGLRLIWSEFGCEQAPGLQVEVEVQLAGDAATSFWKLRIERLGALVTDELVFPRVTGLLPADNGRLAVPVWQGQLALDPGQRLNPPGGKPQRWEWEYPGMFAMQCLAYYHEGGAGFYLACDDADVQRKTFAVFGGDSSDVGCEVLHLPERSRSTPGRFELPYRVELGAFVGDWFTAAERYRAWATNQSWARQSRLRRGLVPDWVRQTGMWVWNRGRSPGVLVPAVELQSRLGLPVSVLWHWWHGCSYDTGFPEYLPPREGAEPFRAALATAHRHDVHALVYMNQRLWGMNTRSWTNQQAERFAVKDAAGRIHSEVYNPFTKAPCVPMCMGTDFWRKTYAGLAEEVIRGLGVDGVYMDQACTTLACYDPTHGHPVGGGRYWMEGFQKLVADIRQEGAVKTGRSSGVRKRAVAPKFVAESPAKPTVALAGEGCGEPWLPYLDLMLSLQISRERYSTPDGWETIPFFNAVYHDCVVTFGNYSSLTMPPYDDLWPAELAPTEPLKLLDPKFARQFYLEQLRSLVWGQQPTVANFLPEHLHQRATETEYATRLAKLRSRFPQYFVHGTMLRPPRLAVAEAQIAISRLSIYAGQQDGLKVYEKRVPLALASAWRAPNGAVAVVLGAIADAPTDLTLDWEAKDYDLPKRGWIYRIDGGSRELLGTWDVAAPSLRLTLPPRGACVLEFQVRKGG